MIVVSHPTGNQFVRALVEALEAQHGLAEFATTVAINRHASWLYLIPRSLRSEILRRTFDGLPAERIHTRSLREVVRFAASRLRLSALTRHEQGWASADAVYRDFDANVARRLPGLAALHG